jgi:hypothetical protein
VVHRQQRRDRRHFSLILALQIKASEEGLLDRSDATRLDANVAWWFARAGLVEHARAAERRPRTPGQRVAWERTDAIALPHRPVSLI